MCGCEPTFVCSKCEGTRLDDRYLELPDDREDELRRRFGTGGGAADLGSAEVEG